MRPEGVIVKATMTPSIGWDRLAAGGNQASLLQPLLA